jgi:Uma2 family endonuclease
MSQPIPSRRLTLAEYLDLERSSPRKHEYYQGEIYAMAGGTPEHGLVQGNVVRALGNHLAASPCVVLTRDVNVYIEASELGTYPDAFVVCGAVERHATLENSVVNPKLVVEVLSPSTEAYDRGAKFDHYKRLGSFLEYVLIATDRFHVDRFVRQTDGSWRATSYSGREATLPLESIGCEVPLREIYEKVELVAPVTDEPSPRPPGVGPPIARRRVRRMES